MFNDSNISLSYTETRSNTDYSFKTFFNSQSSALKKSMVSINPMYKILYNCCDNDSISVYDLPNEKDIMFGCSTCGNVAYIGQDPYRADNIHLINDCLDYPNYYPYLYLTLSNNTINHELDYFEKHYAGRFYGIKVNPKLCNCKISEINFNSNHPLIIEIGATDYNNTEDIIEFSKKYKGNVLLTQLPLNHLDLLDYLWNYPNIYIQISPSHLSDSIINNPDSNNTIKCVSDYINILIDKIGVDKIIFGSNMPFGSERDAEILYQTLDLPKEIKEKIFKTNFETFNKSKKFIKPKQITQNQL